jgi:hypothetical protein
MNADDVDVTAEYVRGAELVPALARRYGSKAGLINLAERLAVRP